MEDFERTTVGSEQEAQKQLELPATLKISLSFTKGPLKGKRAPFTKTVMNVGRKEQADIVVPDPTVSGAHARFEVNNGVVTLIDRESTNGTFVGGAKVDNATVNNMDEVGFGDSRALLTIVNDPYGLYSDDFAENEAAEAADTSQATGTPFNHCLICGYPPKQKSVLENLVGGKGLSETYTTVNDGGEFIQAVSIGFRDKKPVDLVITEVHIPVLTGLQAGIAMRYMEKAFKVKNPAPLVVFTERACDEGLNKALEYLKPAKYLQAVGEPAEFERRAAAIVQRLKELGFKRKSG